MKYERNLLIINTYVYVKTYVYLVFNLAIFITSVVAFLQILPDKRIETERRGPTHSIQVGGSFRWSNFPQKKSVKRRKGISKGAIRTRTAEERVSCVRMHTNIFAIRQCILRRARSVAASSDLCASTHATNSDLYAYTLWLPFWFFNNSNTKHSCTMFIYIKQ